MKKGANIKEYQNTNLTHSKLFNRKRSLSQARNEKYILKQQIIQKLDNKYKINKMMINSTGKQIFQPQFTNNYAQKNNSCPLDKAKVDLDNKVQHYRLSKNEAYLSKMRNMRKSIINEGISLFSPQKHSQKTEQLYQQQQQGLNKFTNIIIKRLESKFNKVSFSQFLEIKKQKDFQTKFNYLLPKKSQFSIKAKNEVVKVIQPFLFDTFNEDCRKHYKSAMLQDQKRTLVKTKFKDASKLHTRYNSISGLNQHLAINKSLQISKMQLNN